MILIDENLLDIFRHKTTCEYCGKKVRTGLDPAHVFSRGAGRVDHAWNLVALDRTCHTNHHFGMSPTRAELLEIIARREGVLAESIAAEIYRIRRKGLKL